MIRSILAVTFSLGLVTPALQAQTPTLQALATRLAAIPAPVGHEGALADTLLQLLPGARRDRAGSVVLTLGQGSPRRLVACPLDEPGWVIGGIRTDGFLTLRRLPGPVPALFDQQLEGQRVTVLGSDGPVPGVVGVRSVHLTRGRSGTSEPFTFDDAFVDVGARSEQEARALGLTETDPLVLEKHPWPYGHDRLAAPVAGVRAACAALVRTAHARRVRGTVIVAFTVEQRLARRGILTVAQEAGPFAESLMLDAGPGDVPVSADTLRTPAHGQRLGRLTAWRLRNEFDGWPVETVSIADAAALERMLGEWIGGAP